MRIIRSFAALVPGVLVFAAVVLAAASAFAQESGDKAWYLEAHGNTNFTQSADLYIPDVAAAQGDLDFRGKVTFNTGWGGGLAAGRVFNDFRVEAELSWRRIGIDHIENIKVDQQVPQAILDVARNALSRNLEFSGRLDHLTGMVNAYWDIPTGTRFRPYVGGGMGTVHAVMHKKARNLTRTPEATLRQFSQEVQDKIREQGGILLEDDKDQDRWGFCWQAAGGVAFDLTESLAVRAGYRFMHVPNLDFSLFQGQRLSTDLPITITVKPVHSIDLGLRLRF